MLVLENELPAFGREIIERLAKCYVPPDAILASWARLFLHVAPQHAALCQEIINVASMCAQTDVPPPPGAFPYALYGRSKADAELSKWFEHPERNQLFLKLEEATLDYVHVASPQDGEQRFLMEQVHPAWVALGRLIQCACEHTQRIVRDSPAQSQLAAMGTASRCMRALAHHAPRVRPELESLQEIPWSELAATLVSARDTNVTESLTSYAFSAPLEDAALLTRVRYTVGVDAQLGAMRAGVASLIETLRLVKNLRPPPDDEPRAQLESDLAQTLGTLDGLLASLALAFDENNMTAEARKVAQEIHESLQKAMEPVAAPVEPVAAPVEMEQPPAQVEPEEKEEEPSVEKTKKRKRPTVEEPTPRANEKAPRKRDEEEEEQVPPPSKRPKMTPLRRAFVEEMQSGIGIDRAVAIASGMISQLLASFSDNEEHVAQIRNVAMASLLQRATPEQRLQVISSIASNLS